MNRKLILSAILTFCVAMSSRGQQQPSPQQQPTVVQRFQVVNPTPDRAMHIMLVDTVTGRTWLLTNCKDKDGQSYFCWSELERYAVPEGKVYGR